MVILVVLSLPRLLSLLLTVLILLRQAEGTRTMWRRSIRAIVAVLRVGPVSSLPFRTGGHSWLRTWARVLAKRIRY